MNHILALDLSPNRAGVCRCVRLQAGQPVFETKTVHVPPLRVPGARAGTEKNAPRQGAARLLWWKEWLIEEIAAGLEIVAMESLSFAARDTERSMAKLQGVVELTCFERDVPLVFLDAKSIKKYATGIGDCDKQRMLDTAVEAFGEQVAGEDEADAAWLCHAALSAFGSGEPDNPYRLSVAQRLAGGLK